MELRLGTRGSKLAMWQAEFIATQLQAAGATVQIIPYETKGDKILDTTIAKIGSKGVFTEELEQDLAAGIIDLAVHSAKDLQSTMPAGLHLIAFTEREKAHDVVLSLDPNLDLGKDGLVVGSSSTRRRAFLARNYPHIKAVEARGNLQTRLQKLKDGHYEAMLLAYAGVHRMGFDQYVVHQFGVEEFVPPTGQGSIAIQVHERLSEAAVSLIRNTCNHAATSSCLIAERAYLAQLDGGCSIPVFAHATRTGATLNLHAGIVSLDGQQLIERKVQTDIIEGHEGAELGKNLALEIQNAGGNQILAAIRAQLN